MTKIHAGLTSAFDDRLSSITHYSRYPEMMVAVGKSYPGASLRVLVLAESHYLDGEEPSNHPGLWYDRRDLTLEQTPRNINTRNVFDNAIHGRKRSKSKAIFHALASALQECGINDVETPSPLQSIAYMNYFQRPSERPGKSIKVHARDVAESANVVLEVVATLQPQLVVFATRLGWHHAKNGIARHLQPVQVTNIPHPATSWWNRPSRPMKGLTGRRRLIEAVAEARKCVAPGPGPAPG